MSSNLLGGCTKLIEGDKLLESENVTQFGLEACIEAFFLVQLCDSNNFVHFSLQTYMEIFFIKFLSDDFGWIHRPLSPAK